MSTYKRWSKTWPLCWFWSGGGKKFEWESAHRGVVLFHISRRRVGKTFKKPLVCLGSSHFYCSLRICSCLVQVPKGQVIKQPAISEVLGQIGARRKSRPSHFHCLGRAIRLTVIFSSDKNLWTNCNIQSVPNLGPKRDFRWVLKNF